MNHKEKLLEVYKKSFDTSDIKNIPAKTQGYLTLITDNIDRNKGVYTVLVTLMVHKLLYPKQDIRYFQNKMKNGFSARTIDTKYITPTLKKLGLLSMAESGWLTRSLEQPYPYKMNYKGEISGVGMELDYKTINTALYNFFDNAIKYIKPGSPIRLFFNAEKEKFELKIVMMSLRIEQDELKKIFEFRYRGVNVKNIDGLGIGMHVVQKALALNSFSIKVSPDYSRMENYEGDQYILNEFSICGPIQARK